MRNYCSDCEYSDWSYKGPTPCSDCRGDKKIKRVTYTLQKPVKEKEINK